MLKLDDLYTAKEASQQLGKEDSYIRTLHNKTPEKLPKGEYRKIGRELIITKAGIEIIRRNLKNKP
ncbi:hypothetical protein EFR49_01580 [Latilactobacillus curvatus]|uniref:helix-turn-helix domain-containing protein n=1 Tax=Latilactobacillus curvatus TaxID=28038 RepID=UPI001C003500|nr:helix-turn-helix domain-containing protein [Latilactobacillus curvatus]MCT3528241.1 hypothetical protein [Latilactobacillus curvatus]MCT3532233.1 hypothetical protein [Latilactobacillus curvatus]QWF35074.1 hypothetical protein KME73_06185 [Latilactobacillus curvatus]